jgi:hypothetical protein
VLTSLVLTLAALGAICRRELIGRRSTPVKNDFFHDVRERTDEFLAKSSAGKREARTEPVQKVQHYLRHNTGASTKTVTNSEGTSRGRKENV